jgi:uncharacterized protein (DUF433 family)
MDEIVKIIEELNLKAKCHQVRDNYYFVDLTTINDAWKLYKALKLLKSVELDNTIKQYQDGLYTLTLKQVSN